MTTWFVVGTDTGVGKTTIGAAVVSAARARGKRAVGIKPVESGCRMVDGALFPEDATLLHRAGGEMISLEEVCQYRFEEPVAPGVAADMLGVEIDFERIAENLDRILARELPDMAVVEGAGGLLVPLGAGRMVADLVERLGLPVVVVGRAALGTINHTLLTIEGLRARSARVAFVVLSATEPVDSGFAASNAREIEAASGVRVAGVVPWCEKPQAQARARLRQSSVEGQKPRAKGLQLPDWVEKNLVEWFL